MTIPKPTFRDLILLIVIGLLVVFIWRGCGQRKTWEQAVIDKEAARKKTIDSVNSILKILQEEGEKKISKLVDQNDSLEGEVEVLKYERNESWKALGATAASAKDLIQKIRIKAGKDSADCLELAEKAEQAARQVVYYEVANSKLLKKLEVLGNTKDSIIAEERHLKKAALETGLQTAKAYSDLFQSMKKVAPHNSVWIGGEVGGTPYTLLAGPQLAFQTKKGTQYTIGAGMDSRNSSYYVKGGILFKISFRKK